MSDRGCGPRSGPRSCWRIPPPRRGTSASPAASRPGTLRGWPTIPEGHHVAQAPAHRPVPELTALVARAAFPKGNPYLRLRDELGTLFGDDDFADLYPDRGQPALPPWRLALVTVLQFREDLSDRRAADAVRARIDWKYLLGLELTDPGFDASVLCEFRSRLLAGEAEERLLEKLLERCQGSGLLKARGRQRTDATHVLASIRTMNRLELLAETLRAALNELATVAPEWLAGVARPSGTSATPAASRTAACRRSKADREAYARAGGPGRLHPARRRWTAPEAPAELRALADGRGPPPGLGRHFRRDARAGGRVRLRAEGELPPAAEGIESPYDPEARYRSKREHALDRLRGPDRDLRRGRPHLITHVATTTAAVTRSTARRRSRRRWPGWGCRRASTWSTPGS